MPPFRTQTLTFIRSFLPKDKTLLIFILAGLTGFGGSLAVVAFRTIFVGIQHLFYAQAQGMVTLAEALPLWERILLPVLGGVLAGTILHIGLPWAAHRGSENYLEALTIGDGKLSVRQTLIKSLSSLCSIGSGASIGREGPMIQLAAMVGSSIGRFLELPQSRLRLLVACGATAGLTSAYNAPIASLLFVSEIALGSLSRDTLAPLIIASVMASVTTHRFFGFKAVYEMPPLSVLTSASGTVYYMGLGLVCGLLSPVFRWVLDQVRQRFQKMALSRISSMALGGLGVGLISVWHPNVWGNGYSVVTEILHASWTWQALLAILAFKIFATSLSYGSGAVGGIFTPTLFVGAALGALYAHGILLLAPDFGPEAPSFTIIGMGAFLAAVTYAPLMSILMIFEMTLSYELILPLMLACVIGYYIAHKIRPDSIYKKPKSLPSTSPKAA